MKLFAFIIVVMAVCVMAWLYAALRKRKEVPVIDVDSVGVKNPIPGKKVVIDFSHIVFPDNEVRPIINDDVYIVRGKKFSRRTLSDGRRLSVKSGDCIIVDRTITQPDISRYKLFLVRTEVDGIDLKTADEVVFETPILGTVIAKVPRSSIDSIVWK